MTLGSAAQPRVIVDLRATWPDARDQNGRNTCLACATSDAHAHAHGITEALSAEYLLHHAAKRMPGHDATRGLTFEAVEHALETQGQPTELQWPYLGATAPVKTPPAFSNRWFGECKSPGSGGKAAKQLLEANTPIVLGILLTQAFMDPIPDPYVIPAKGTAIPAGHAVLGVGLGVHPSIGDVILIRNSWGPRWANAGHAWLAINYLDDKLVAHRAVSPLSRP